MNITSAECYAEVTERTRGSRKSYHNHVSETKVSFGQLGFSPSFGKDSDDEIATEQLTAVVDSTFLPHDNPEIS